MAKRKKLIKLPALAGTIRQIQKKLCGEFLGSGVYRDVYALIGYPDYVIKIERDPSTGQFANACEWRNYIDLREWKELGPWLAPCEAINETGQVLIQRRVYREGKRSKDYPTHIPVYFTDTKRENFGWLSTGEFVCCDYSLLLSPPAKKKMKGVRWWTLKKKGEK